MTRLLDNGATPLKYKDKIFNEKDILEIKADYIKDMNFHYVTDMLSVVKLALLDKKVKNAFGCYTNFFWKT